jgi:hypothetical protein
MGKLINGSNHWTTLCIAVFFQDFKNYLVSMRMLKNRAWITTSELEVFGATKEGAKV